VMLVPYFPVGHSSFVASSLTNFSAMDNFFLSKCEFGVIFLSEDLDAPVIARADPGRPSPLLIGWNRNLWSIDVELKDSEEKSGRFSRAIAHVDNLNKSRTTVLMTLCHIYEPIATFKSTKQLVEAIRDAIKGML
jgi:hypothetical protein